MNLVFIHFAEPRMCGSNRFRGGVIGWPFRTMWAFPCVKGFSRVPASKRPKYAPTATYLAASLQQPGLSAKRSTPRMLSLLMKSTSTSKVTSQFALIVMLPYPVLFTSSAGLLGLGPASAGHSLHLKTSSLPIFTGSFRLLFEAGCASIAFVTSSPMCWKAVASSSQSFTRNSSRVVFLGVSGSGLFGGGGTIALSHRFHPKLVWTWENMFLAPPELARGRVTINSLGSLRRPFQDPKWLPPCATPLSERRKLNIPGYHSCTTYDSLAMI
mmetsp:Transcript_29240/g.66254  ORF Transcript_29240/g.66254 Transcript_29240/m.66254 type:complete len:270 (-) Transcript_29240:8795-9604(-)